MKTMPKIFKQTPSPYVYEKMELFGFDIDKYKFIQIIFLQRNYAEQKIKIWFFYWKKSK